MFLFFARNDTHSPAVLKPPVGSVSVVVPLNPMMFSVWSPEPRVIGVEVTVMVLFAFAAA